MMKKIILSFALLTVFFVMLVGCGGEERLTRVDVQEINTDGKYGDVVMITDNESIELLREVFEKVKWDPNTVVNMARIADVKATLFFEFDENMPERLYEYDIWFNESAGTAAIVSNNEKEGYGELDKENAEILKRELLNRLKERKPITTSSVNWEVTPTFGVQIETPEGKRGVVLRGIEGKVAFLDTMDYSAGKENKTRWFFWGEELKEVNEENFKLIGVHKETGEEKTLIDSNNWERVNPEYKDTEIKSVLGAQSSQHTVFAIPLTGLWRLDAYIGEKLYGSIVVEVKK